MGLEIHRSGPHLEALQRVCSRLGLSTKEYRHWSEDQEISLYVRLETPNAGPAVTAEHLLRFLDALGIAPHEALVIAVLGAGVNVRLPDRALANAMQESSLPPPAPELSMGVRAVLLRARQEFDYEPGVRWDILIEVIDNLLYSKESADP